MDVNIQVQGGKVTVTVDESPSSQSSSQSSNFGALTAQGNVSSPATVGNQGGSSPGNQGTDSGGGAPGSGVVVIGPIVIGSAALQGANAGNDGGSSPGNQGTDSGGGSPGSGGVLVIGPIVICGSASTATTSSAAVDEAPPS